MGTGSEKSLKILVVSSRFPYPAVGGDRLKTYYLLRCLSNYFKVSLVCLVDEFPEDQNLQHIESFVDNVYVYQIPKWLSLIQVAKGIFSYKPLQVSYYYHQKIKKQIKKHIEESDIVVPILVRTTEYVLDSGKPILFDMVDSIALNYQRSQEKVTSLFWKTLYSIETKRLLIYEKLCVQKANITALVNQKESFYWAQHGYVEWLPNGVSDEILQYHQHDDQYENHVVFLGKMNYQPNIDAVVWFIDHVFPLLDSRIHFTIVGSEPKQSLIDRVQNHPRIHVTGFVEDPYIILKSCLVVVAPMQTGGGIQNKILEAMGLGCLVIASSLAAEPINVFSEKSSGLIVLDDPKKIASVVCDAYENPRLFTDCKFSAREYIKKQFSWSHYESKLVKLIYQIAEN